MNYCHSLPEGMGAVIGSSKKFHWIDSDTIHIIPAIVHYAFHKQVLQQTGPIRQNLPF